MLYALDSTIGEIYGLAPIGSAVQPFPESPQVDMETLGCSFRLQRGGSCSAMEALAARSKAICTVFGVLLSLFAQNA